MTGFAGLPVIFTGQCLECGEEWRERSEPAVCPECHSLEVVTLNIEDAQTPTPRQKGANRV